MNTEDEEFNRIEREAKQRMEAVKDTIRYRDAFPKDYRLPKPWVGLTDEEIETLIHRFGGDPHTLLDEVDARLKGKNT